jgi:hypothetical protein
MNRRDRNAWKAAPTLDDLAELVVRYLNGDIKQTPSYMGPVEAETLPIIAELTLINRGGFITENSQYGDDCPWGNAWVDGFATDHVLARMIDAAAGTPLVVAACDPFHHEHKRAEHLVRCVRRELVGYWKDGCPNVAGFGLDACWFVSVEDPQVGRNDLWGTLARALSVGAS